MADGLNSNEVTHKEQQEEIAILVRVSYTLHPISHTPPLQAILLPRVKNSFLVADSPKAMTNLAPNWAIGLYLQSNL